MKLALLTVCYNSIATIEDTLDSIKNQTVPPDYYLVVDGQSTDGTLDVLEKYGSYVDRLISEKDSGIYNAMNKGIKLLTDILNEDEDWYIWILNSDDLIYSNTTIHKIKQLHLSLKSDCYFYSIVQFSQSSIRSWPSARSVKEALNGNSCPHPGCISSVKVYKEIGLFEDKWLISADLEWMHKLFIRDRFSVYFSEEIISRMRLGGISTNGFKSKMISIREIYTINRNLKVPALNFIINRVFRSLVRNLSFRKL